MKDGFTDRFDQEERQWAAAPIVRKQLRLANIEGMDTQQIQTKKSNQWQFGRCNMEQDVRSRSHKQSRQNKRRRHPAPTKMATNIKYNHTQKLSPATDLRTLAYKQRLILIPSIITESSYQSARTSTSPAYKQSIDDSNSAGVFTSHQ